LSLFFFMSPVLFELNGVLPNGKYLLGQPRFRSPVRLTQAVLTCRPPATGTLTLALEVGGLLSGVAFTVRASTDDEVRQTLGLSLSLPANTLLRWKASFDDAPENAASNVAISVGVQAQGILANPRPALGLVWVNRQERSTLFAYDPVAHSFFETAAGISSGRASVTASGSNLIFAFNGAAALVITAGGIETPCLREGSLVTAESPRLEFMADGLRVATLTATGLLVRGVNEALPSVLSQDDPAFWSRFELWAAGALRATISPDGLTTMIFEQAL
jgi:hypothetical protein